MRELYCTSKKTDRVDAKKLANRLKRHIEDADPDDGFPEVWVPDEATERLRTLIGHYGFIRRQVVSTKNRMSLVYRRRMIRLPDAGAETVRKNLGHSLLREEDRFGLELGLQRLALLVEQRAAVRSRIEKQAVAAHPGPIRLLVSIPGVSIFIAATVMADIGDIRRFASAKKLSA